MRMSASPLRWRDTLAIALTLQAGLGGSPARSLEGGRAEAFPLLPRDYPYALITELTLPDGTTLPAAAGTVLSGSLPWFGLRAEELTGDCDNVLFQFNLDGSWHDVDLNDDEDFYTDLDGVSGFQAAGADETFLDNGNFVYDAGGDTCLWNGGDGVVDTAPGTSLMPLVGEDGANGMDDDRDGLVDEDGSADPRDYVEPFFVFVDLAGMALPGDRYLRLRAVAADSLGNCDPEGAPDLLLIINMQEPPLAEVIRVTNAAAEPLDVWPESFDGDGVEAVGSAASDSLLTVRVNAEGALPIEYVDLLWRLNPPCYPELRPEENPWRSMSADGFTAVDSLLPYEFAVDLARIAGVAGNAAIVFYPQATDNDANSTPPPWDPWAMRVYTNHARITTTLPDGAQVGEEILLAAALDEPEEATVAFWFAERLLEEDLDPLGISQAPPYLSAPLIPPMASGLPAGDQAELRVNGIPATWYADLSILRHPTKYDWSLTAGAVEFGARPDSSDAITISYNHTDYVLIGEPDDEPPFLGGWTSASGGVPQPLAEATEAYDLVATASVDSTSGDTCGLQETAITEQRVLRLHTNQGVIDSARAAEDRLALILPSPYRPGGAIIVQTSTQAAWVEAEIYTPDGRRLRRLSALPRTAGLYELRWDGSAADGRATFSGLYLIAVSTGGQREVQRFLFLR